jgi:hypothetical protein
VGNAVLPTKLISPVFGVVNGGHKGLPTILDWADTSGGLGKLSIFNVLLNKPNGKVS